MLVISNVHDIFRTRFTLPIVRSGQENESPTLPYMSYINLSETRYQDYQVIRDLTLTDSIQYKNPVRSNYRYTVVADSRKDSSQGENIIASEKLARDIFNFISTVTFELAMKRLDVKYNLLSDLQEVDFNQNDFYERRFFFTINYFWADLFTEDEGERIESISGTNLNENANGDMYSQTKP